MKQEEASSHQMGNATMPNAGDLQGRQNPELPRIYSDNNDKKRMIFHWAVFVGIIILTMGLGVVIPHALQHRLPNNEICGNPIGFNPNNTIKCQPFSISNLSSQPVIGGVITNLVDMNQFMLTRIQFLMKQPSSSAYSFTSRVSYSFYALKHEQNTYKLQKEYIKNQEETLTVNSKEAEAVYNQKNSKLLESFDRSFLYLKEIDYKHFLFTVQFQPAAQTQLNSVQQIRLYATVISLGYSQFSVAIRYIFFFLTIASTIFYAYRLKKIKETEKILQQKMVLALSIATIFFNDPFYVITITNPNYASNVFSVMFVTTLATFLVVFWMIILNRINDENDQIASNAFTWKKGVFMVVLWLSCLFYYMFYSFAYFNINPLMNTAEFNKGGMVYLMMWIIVLFVGGFSYMIAQYIQIFLKFESKLWRHQLFVFFSIFFIIVTFFFLFINGFDIHSFVGGRVLMLYVEVNLYLFYMQYMYSPTTEAIERSQRGGAGGFEMAQVNTNLDEMRSVEINFPDDYNNMPQDEESQDFDQKPKKKPSGHSNEQVIEFE